MFSGPRIHLPPFGATTGVLHHRSLLIAPAVTANVLAALVDDLREMIGTGIETETETTIVIGGGEVGPLTGGEVHPPIAGGTIATVTAPELLQSKMTKKRIEKRIGLRPLLMIIES